MKAIYTEIAEQLATELKALPPGKRLPGSARLAAHFRVNQRTVMKAIHLLADRHEAIVDGTRGVFARPVMKMPIHHRLAAIGIPPDCRVAELMQRQLKGTGTDIVYIDFNREMFEDKPHFLLDFPVDGFLFRYSRSFTLRQAEVFRTADRPAAARSLTRICSMRITASTAFIWRAPNIMVGIRCTRPN